MTGMPLCAGVDAARLDATHRRRAERALRTELDALLADADAMRVDHRRAQEALALILARPSE